jgi:hypothetical protein
MSTHVLADNTCEQNCTSGIFEWEKTMTKHAQFKSLIDGFVESVNRFPSREALVVDDERNSTISLPSG